MKQNRIKKYNRNVSWSNLKQIKNYIKFNVYARGGAVDPFVHILFSFILYFFSFIGRHLPKQNQTHFNCINKIYFINYSKYLLK